MARIRKPESGGSAALKDVIWGIALYIRLSKDDGNDESLSVTNQRKILREYAEMFFQGEHIIIGEYIDDGKTGTDYDRPAFMRMIRDVESKKVNCIICKNLARAFRNYSDQGYFIESFFPRHGTRFVTIGDPKVDTYLNPEAVSGMELPINGLMNDRFAAQTSSSVRRTFDNKRRRGEFIGAFAPYGYAKNPADRNAFVIDEDAARVVKDIFLWFVYGDGSPGGNLSKEGIARNLNYMGVPNPTLYKAKKGLRYKNPHAKKNDGLWTGTSISRILKNKIYLGTMVQGRQRVVSYKVHIMMKTPEEEWYQVEHTHEPIISPDLFEKAQRLCEKDTRAAPGKKKNYLFSGFLKCADCGKAMTRRASSGFVYFNCSTYKRKSKEKCTKHTIRLDALERTVLAVIRKQIELAEAPKEIIRNISEVQTVQPLSARLNRLLTLRECELEKTELLISGLYIDWKNGDLTREQYHKMKARLEKQEMELKTVMERIKGEIAVSETELPPGDSCLEEYLKHGNISALSQGLLAELIDAIHIHEGGGISIFFKYIDPFMRAGVLSIK